MPDDILTSQPAAVARPIDAPAAGAAFARVEIVRDMAAAEAMWSELTALSLATPYQSYPFLKAWADHAAGPSGVASLIVVAFDAHGPVALLPLGVQRRFGVRVASFLGGSHCNYNAPIVRLDRIERFGAGECMRLLREAARLGGIDAYVLTNQPAAWRGVANPFVGLPGQPSPDPAFSGALADTYEQHLKTILSSKARSKQRRKMRRFEEMGAARLYKAETPEERTRLVEAYLEQKRGQLAARGIASVFDKPGVAAFVAAACGTGGGHPAVELYGFELDGQPIAVTGALPLGDRLSCMFNSIAAGETAKYSPGELLLGFVVQGAIERGFRVFDLGAGAAPYKRMFCPDVEQLRDSIIGVSLQGRAVASALAGLRATKARIKANPRAYGLIERVRKLRARGDAAEPTPDED